MKHWVWGGVAAAGIAALLVLVKVVDGVERSGTERAGIASAPAVKERASTPRAQHPSDEQVLQTVQDYLQQHTATDGTFAIDDQQTGATRRLQLIRVRKRVGKTGGLFYTCTDLRDVNTAELVDLDFDVMPRNGTLTVVDTWIHKVEGKARYTYDADDNRIPVASSAR